MTRSSHTRRAAFVRGLSTPSVLTVAAGLLLVAAALAGLQALVAGGGFTVIPEGRMLRIPNDDYVHVSYRIAQLRQRPPSGEAVYLFGGSGTIEMMHSEAALAAAVSGDAGRRIAVVSLATHNQSLAQTLALIDNLPPAPQSGTLLAVGLSPNRFTATPEEDLGLLGGRVLALTSPAMSRFLAGYAHRGERLPGMLPGALGFAVSYVRERASLAHPWFTALSYSHHYITGDYHPPMSARRAGSLEELVRERPLYAANVAYNDAALGEIVTLARRRGFAVMFFEQPLAPEASGPGWDPYLTAYRSHVAALAGRLDVTYVAVQPRARLGYGDFGDLWHLNGYGRDKWTPPFARALARLLP